MRYAWWIDNENSCGRKNGVGNFAKPTNKKHMRPTPVLRRAYATSMLPSKANRYLYTHARTQTHTQTHAHTHMYINSANY